MNFDTVVAAFHGVFSIMMDIPFFKFYPLAYWQMMI